MENSNISKLQERADAINAKIEKAQGTIAKYQKQFEKVLDAYKKEKRFHKYLPYEIFANFQPTDDKSWDTAKYNKEASKIIHNAIKEYDYNEDALDIIREIFYDYFEKAAGLFYSIEEKKKFIEEQQEKLKDIAARMKKEGETDKSIKDLFEQVPELAKFIEECGERQYAFFVDFNEKLKKAWDAYYKADKEACEYYNHSDDDWGTKNRKYHELRKACNDIKPKQIVRTPEQIRKDVEQWKQAERRFLAERITTEFGKVIKCTLYQGDDGNVNGVITGSLKTAKIETIWAGGYNIQCLHTRFLVHEK